MTNLLYKQKKIPPIDPYNPFENPMENTDYNQDYSQIVPQISEENCRIPLIPGRAEKKSIRKYYNIAGVILLLFSLISNFLPAIMEMIVYIFIKNADTVNNIDTSSYSYYYNTMTYIADGSSIEAAILLIVHLIFNVAIALLGLKLINVKPSELFQTTDLKKGNIVKYIFIGITIQYALSLIMGIIVQLFSQNGIDIVEADLVETGNAKSIALEIIYACIVAPLTEELLFRGFAMKSLSRVSQRFAIIMSAFIFGLIHGNVTQFVVAFVLGIFMGYIDIKHNSLIPSIAIHVAMNTFASILNYLSLFSGTTGDIIEYVLSFFICIIMIIGAVMFILFAKDNRLPYNTPHQSVRSNSMILKSPALVILIVFEIALIVATNVLNNQ